jgi:glycosyltransferase involved in cell wall biosynthesis
MWKVIGPHLDERELLVWIHGSEIQPWHRRLFNFSTEEEIKEAKVLSLERMNFWKPFLKDIKSNIKLIFVSKYFAKEVMEDTGVDIPGASYEIIHNPINTSTFNYVEKPPSQRFKILTIRPFASNKYANDLTVKAIIHLSKMSIFSDMQFLIVGDGRLFDETIEPLRNFNNVIIQQGFLSHDEISSLHKEYGIFITPTRMDSQGVSRDEAMSSGMVPITTNVTAIPEFVDNECGMLVEGEDWEGMANAILTLVENPELFIRLSRSAAKRVRNQTGSNIVIQQEIDLIKGDL